MTVSKILLICLIFGLVNADEFQDQLNNMVRELGQNLDRIENRLRIIERRYLIEPQGNWNNASKFKNPTESYRHAAL